MPNAHFGARWVLWLGGHIPITDMLIHRITHLPHEALNPTKEFGGKTGEKELVERMKCRNFE